MNVKIKILVLFVLCLSVAGCSMKVGQKTSTDGGVYVSSDKGETWVQKAEYLNIGANRSFFKTTQSVFIKQDTRDPKAIYLATLQDGFLYSYDGGNSWQRTLTGVGVIYDVSTDIKSVCVLYVAAGNRLWKTEDCNRNWKQIYVDEIKNQSIKSVIVDSNDNNIIYLATSDGRIIKSEDFGRSWKTIMFFDDLTIVKMISNPNNTNRLYVSTVSNGIFRSDNQGVNWINIVDNIDVGDPKQNKNILNYRDFELDLSKEDALIYASKYGIFYSQNAGDSWNFIHLLTKINAVTIYSIAMNPNNSNEIYYTTAKSLYKSVDGGVKWVTKNLPSQRTPIDILVDYGNEKNIFMAFRKFDK